MNPRETLTKIKTVISLTTDLFGYIDFDLGDLNISDSTLNLAFQTRYNERWCAPMLELFIQKDSDGGKYITSMDFQTIGDFLREKYQDKWDRMKAVALAEYDPLHNYRDEMHELTHDTDELHGTSTNVESNSDTRTDDLTRTDSLRKTDNYIKDDNYETDKYHKSVNGDNASIYGFDSEDEPVPSTYNDSRNSTNEKENYFGTTQNNRTETNTGTVKNTGTVTDVGSKNQTGGNDSIRTYDRSKDVIHTGNIGNLSYQNLLQQEIELWQWNIVDQIVSDVADVLTLNIY